MEKSFDMRKKLAFNPAKLMILLIAISILVAALSPIISKKLRLQDKSYWDKTHVQYEEINIGENK